MRRCLSVLAVGALTGAVLLVPSVASAKSHSYWSTKHAKSGAHARVSDPENGITWTVLDHKIIVTTPGLVVVPFVYTCGTKAGPRGVQYDPAAFQSVVADVGGAAAYTDAEASTDFPTFACDGTEHTTDVVLDAQQGSFENGNIEVGLIRADAGSSVNATFEHAVVGYDQLHDTRAPVTVTVNATPESTKPGSKITVKGTVKRDGKAYKGKDATLYFQNEAGDPAVKTATAVTTSKGKLTAKVTVTGPGIYFWTTTSTTKTQAGASLGDYADAA